MKVLIITAHNQDIIDKWYIFIAKSCLAKITESYLKASWVVE